MAYFTSAYINFFKQLGANNNRDWFHANKKSYENDVKKPFANFVGDLIDAVNKKDPSVVLEVKNAVFRINRDIRFSKDKTPYKVHMAAIVSPAGRKDHRTPGIYIMMGAEKVTVGGGMYGPTKEDIYAIREAMSKDPKAYNKIVNAKAFKEMFGAIQGEENKIIPKEFKPAIESVPDIMKKQWYYMVDLPPETCLKEDFLDIVMNVRKVGDPIKKYLANAIES